MCGVVAAAFHHKPTAEEVQAEEEGEEGEVEGQGSSGEEHNFRSLKSVVAVVHWLTRRRNQAFISFHIVSTLTCDSLLNFPREAVLGSSTRAVGGGGTVAVGREKVEEEETWIAAAAVERRAEY